MNKVYPLTQHSPSARTTSKRHAVSLALQLALCLMAGARSSAQLPGDVDLSFDLGSSINDEVFAAAQQPDGKWIVGGRFTTVHGAMRGGVARLNADGSTDHTFMHGMEGARDSADRDRLATIWSIVVQPDGKILAAGKFDSFNGQSRRHIVRLNADGSLDAAFIGSGGGLVGGSRGIGTLAIQRDENGQTKIVIGGNGIARLNFDGSLDASFYSGVAYGDGPGRIFSSMVAQPDGKILVGATVNGQGWVRRFDANGSWDTSFQSPSDFIKAVNAFVLQDDGKVLVGGAFIGAGNTSVDGLIRFNGDGSIDVPFRETVLKIIKTTDTQFVNGASALAVQSDGKILIGGSFKVPDTAPRAYDPYRSQGGIARLHADGSLDTSFHGGIAESEMYLQGAQLHALALQNDGKIVAGGLFRWVNGVEREHHARLNSDGSLDTSFHNGVPSVSVKAMALQEDGRILIGGGYNPLTGVNRGGIARLHADDSLDHSFQNSMEGANGDVLAIALQSDGKILIGGRFTTVNGKPRGRIARLHPDGSLDESFLNHKAFLNPSEDRIEGIPLGRVLSMAETRDGSIIVAGAFEMVTTFVPGFDRMVGRSRRNIALLEPDGSVPSFTFQVDLGGTLVNPGIINSVVVQPDGRILVGGRFSEFVDRASGSRRHTTVARLNPSGSLDTSFKISIMGENFPVVESVALQPDGKTLVGGAFHSINGVALRNIARLNPNGSLDTSFQNSSDWSQGQSFPSVRSIAVQRDGKILIGGNGLARLNPDGSLDPSFYVTDGKSEGGPSVETLAIQSDGKILIGGDFSSINGVPRHGVARLHSEAGVLPAQPRKSILMRRLGGYKISGEDWTVSTEVAGTLAYLAKWNWNSGSGANTTNSLELIDLRDPLNPRLLGTYRTSGEIGKIQIVGQRAFMTVNNYVQGKWTSKLDIIDVSVPANPRRLGGYESYRGALRGIHVLGNIAYLIGTAGLEIIDTIDPTNPRLLGNISTSLVKWTTDSSAMAVQVMGNLAFVADGDARDNLVPLGGIQIYDVSDPARPRRLGGYTTLGSAQDIRVIGNLAYVAEARRSGTPWLNGGFEVLDISDPANPKRVGGYSTGDSATSLEVVGNLAFISHKGLLSGANLEVIHISDPANPRRLGAYDTYGMAAKIEVDEVRIQGDLAYLRHETGLEIIRYSEILSPFKSDLPMPFRLTAPVRFPDGRFRFALSGEPGRRYTIQVSPDLLTWSDLQTIVPTNASFEFIEAGVGPIRQRFYRLRTQ